MSKTYRNVPEHELIEEELENKKVKRIDRKHDKVIVADGFYSSPVSDEEDVKIGNNVIRFDGIVTPNGKKLAKKITNRKRRHERIDAEENED